LTSPEVSHLPTCPHPHRSAAQTAASTPSRAPSHGWQSMLDKKMEKISGWWYTYPKNDGVRQLG